MGLFVVVPLNPNSYDHYMSARKRLIRKLHVRRFGILKILELGILAETQFIESSLHVLEIKLSTSVISSNSV